ncbi:GntR family transcriptional regulator [Phycisphaerales bacterium AB-hyl4]|uniref:GntR family transcriptional regulator n=1 Tax=Natronomicrosphaera hydrolytica TaxID=3242702 RepID=A0ABV4U4N7_9BACT
MAVTTSQSTEAVRLVGTRLDREHGPHLYHQIAGLVREQVQTGGLKPGDSLPPQRTLSELWQVGEVTVRRALQQLASEGLIQARPGSGTVICDPDADGPARSERAALTLGVAFADLAHGYPYFRPMLAGVRDDGCDVAMRLFDMPHEEQHRGSLAHVPPLAELDGLIMMSPVNLALLALCQRQALPTVLLFSDLADGFSHCIMPDYGSGVVEAVSHLVAVGRERIALVTPGPERFSTGRWIDAYRAALRAHDLPIDPARIVRAGYSEQDGAHATRELLALDPQPDAILFASDFMARGGLLTAHAAGLRVPDDLAIVGAGPVLDEGGWTLPLATIDLGLHEMGRRARQTIQACCEKRLTEPARHAVASRYRAGGTA